MSSPSYTPYLIAKYVTGLDNAVQPWLLPDDSQQSLLDGFVYRGVWHKRPGYNQLAIGKAGNHTESRIIVTNTDASFGTGDGSAGPYSQTVANAPISRGSVKVTAGAQSALDNGSGGFITTPAGGSGTIDYISGAISIIFNGSVPGATPITITYSYFPGLPVMMVANFYTAQNTKQLIVADTRNVNKYSSFINRLEYYSNPTPYTGNNSNFFSWTNYPDASNFPRLLFVNNVNPIQKFDGIKIDNKFRKMMKN